MDERLKRFLPHEGFGVCGDKIDTIAKVCLDVFGGDRIIKINVPYHNFNCYGKASDVARDAEGAMPFSKNRIDQSKITTMFYGNRPIDRTNYLPIWSDCDVFFIETINEGDIVEVNLIKAPSWRTYL